MYHTHNNIRHKSSATQTINTTFYWVATMLAVLKLQFWSPMKHVLTVHFLVANYLYMNYMLPV